jgi:hypothetical protein
VVVNHLRTAGSKLHHIRRVRRKRRKAERKCFIDSFGSSMRIFGPNLLPRKVFGGQSYTVLSEAQFGNTRGLQPAASLFAEYLELLPWRKHMARKTGYVSGVGPALIQPMLVRVETLESTPLCLQTRFRQDSAKMVTLWQSIVRAFIRVGFEPHSALLARGRSSVTSPTSRHQTVQKISDSDPNSDE